MSGKFEREGNSGQVEGPFKATSELPKYQPAGRTIAAFLFRDDQALFENALANRASGAITELSGRDGLSEGDKALLATAEELQDAVRRKNSDKVKKLLATLKDDGSESE